VAGRCSDGAEKDQNRAVGLDQTEDESMELERRAVEQRLQDGTGKIGGQESAA
jgi:hypothetical protein